MKKSLILFLALIFLAPSLAFSGIFTFKAGLFIPRAQSDLWTTEFDQMTFNKSHYNTTNFGFAYEYFLTREVSVVLGVDSYSKNKVGTYVDYVGIELVDGDFAFPTDYLEDFYPAHVFNVSITPIQLSAKFTPTGRKGKFIPYLGGGVGLYLWNVRLNGDLIDFDDVWVYVPDDIDIYPIISVDAWESNRISFGYHAFAGIMVPFTKRMSFEAEFKYNRAQGELKEAFLDFEPFDLSAYQISLGLNYWF
ncbi:MAG: outer membrane beta-barrel protein [Candidatus Aminicenantes bacterium]|nr:outer membrane beta-barrel protein [Candidatus Aminicenantes bacterium]